MFNRACRILDKNTRTSASEQQPSGTSSKSAAAAKFTESELNARWKSLVLKIFLMFSTIAAQTKAKLLLGVEVYERVFKTATTAKVKDWTGPFRFCKGQAVGQPRDSGIGPKDQQKAHMDPTMCQHNDQDMMPRGNKTDKWWTCQKCLSRWDRIPDALNPSSFAAPNDEDLVTFGKHAGSTFLHVYLEDTPYCEWVLRTLEEVPTPAKGSPLQRLAQYITAQNIRESYAADGWQDMEQ